MAEPTHEALHEVRDDALGLHAVIAVDSTAAGPAFGGIRRLAYPTLADARADALELAAAMTLKCALAGLPAGGAKTAVMVPDAASTPSGGIRWPEVYRALGDAIAALDGRYVCGPDVGTGQQELSWVRQRCAHVNPEGNDAGASTAAGVLAGLAAVFAALGLSPGRGRRVAIQGLGSVGGAVAATLIARGVEVVGADPDPAAARRAEALGVAVVEPTAVLAHDCDVLMPCAMGHGLTTASVPTLCCRAVCGSANNQLEDAEAAWALHRRAIVHAPDEVVSAGAVIEGVLTVTEGVGAATRARVASTIAATTAVVTEVFDRAAAEDCPPSIAARRWGRQRVADLRRGG